MDRPRWVSSRTSSGITPVKAKLFDIAVPGANSGVANRLHLFDVEHPAPAPEEGIDFDKTDLPVRLTSFLYPDDSDEAGRLLRVYQQYFMVSAGAQLILKELEISWVVSFPSPSLWATVWRMAGLGSGWAALAR